MKYNSKAANRREGPPVRSPARKSFKIPMRDFGFKVNFSLRVTYYLQLRIQTASSAVFRGSRIIRPPLGTGPEHFKHVRGAMCSLFLLMARKPTATLKTVCIQITAHVENEWTLTHVLQFSTSTASTVYIGKLFCGGWILRLLIASFTRSSFFLHFYYTGFDDFKIELGRTIGNALYENSPLCTMVFVPKSSAKEFLIST